MLNTPLSLNLQSTSEKECNSSEQSGSAILVVLLLAEGLQPACVQNQIPPSADTPEIRGLLLLHSVHNTGTNTSHAQARSPCSINISRPWAYQSMVLCSWEGGCRLKGSHDCLERPQCPLHTGYVSAAGTTSTASEQCTVTWGGL